jgi:hypothetical protein
MNSLLETLRCLFPLIIADRIYYFSIKNQQITIKKELLYKFNCEGVKGVLEIKNAIPAFWLINFEDQNIKEYRYTSKNIDIFNSRFKNILIDNHDFIKNWRKRKNNKKNV